MGLLMLIGFFSNPGSFPASLKRSTICEARVICLPISDVTASICLPSMEPPRLIIILITSLPNFMALRGWFNSCTIPGDMVLTEGIIFNRSQAVTSSTCIIRVGNRIKSPTRAQIMVITIKRPKIAVG